MPVARIIPLAALLFCFCSLEAQRQPPGSGDLPIAFGKRISYDGMVDERKYGKSFFAFHETYFINNTLRLNNRNYLRCGVFYQKFERYCLQHNITYDRTALKRFRRASWLSVSIYALCYPVMMIPAFRALNYSNMRFSRALFLHDGQFLFWGLAATQVVVSCKIKGHAERKLRRTIFPDR
jgi:hypothetical protein